MTGMRSVRCGKAEYVPTKIICVGKNFHDHVREMGGSAPPAEPVIFIKPNSSIAFDPSEVRIPSALGLLHHEVELCALVDRCARDVSAEQAATALLGYGVGIDFTLRERQAGAKKAGGPWSLSKCFDEAAVFGEFMPAGDITDPLARGISLSINGEFRQSGNTGAMIFTPADIISFVSRFMTIERGDILMCGTPAGVGEVGHEDIIDAAVEGLTPLHFCVVR